MIPRVPSGTRLIALLGDPVDHSLSPVFQNAAFRDAGVPGVYLPIRCTTDELPELLREITVAGGGGNVTVPHKRLAATLLDERTDAVVRTSACNTFWGEADRIHGDNTDVSGFRAAVRALTGSSPASARVLLVGAGGAARAAMTALEMDLAADVVILNRTPARLKEMMRDFGTGPVRITGSTDPSSVGEERFDLVVNATSLGLRDGDPFPVDPDAVLAGAALDLVYAPGGTRWSRAFSERGIPSSDGIEMLLHQGAAAFERWWGRPAPLERMRASLPRTA